MSLGYSLPVPIGRPPSRRALQATAPRSRRGCSASPDREIFAPPYWRRAMCCFNQPQRAGRHPKRSRQCACATALPTDRPSAVGDQAMRTRGKRPVTAQQDQRHHAPRSVCVSSPPSSARRFLTSPSIRHLPRAPTQSRPTSRPPPATRQGRRRRRSTNTPRPRSSWADRPANPECMWLGRRVVSLLWRDDLDTAFRHLDLYDRFGCPAGHIQTTFRCVVPAGKHRSQGAGHAQRTRPRLLDQSQHGPVSGTGGRAAAGTHQSRSLAAVVQRRAALQLYTTFRIDCTVEFICSEQFSVTRYFCRVVGCLEFAMTARYLFNASDQGIVKHDDLGRT